MRSWRGQNIGARALRSSALTIFNTGAENILRLASNLILTRLLFPEAFGLMALVTIVITGLGMFSDMGLRDAIMRQKTDNRTALNTLWTMKIIRGFILWALACCLAWPAAMIYEEPQLQLLLPVVALSVLIDGFQSTKGPRAIRDLQIGRLTFLKLAAQVIGLIATTLFAWWLQSVWALAIGVILSSALRTVFIHLGIPGQSDRLGWDKTVVWDTLNFGIFLFFSTIASFFVRIGSQMLLGAYVSLALFGIFSIAYGFGNLPRLLSHALARNVLFPLYRLKPPLEAIENQKKLFLARRTVGALGMALAATLALTGDWLISFLFDPRYEAAGAILVLMGLCVLPVMAFMGVQQSLIANGDSRAHLIVTAARAAVQMIFLLVFLPSYGVSAAVLAPLISALATYPLLAVFVARYKTWDAWGEIGLILLSFLLILAIGWVKIDAVSAVFSLPLDL